MMSAKVTGNLIELWGKSPYLDNPRAQATIQLSPDDERVIRACIEHSLGNFFNYSKDYEELIALRSRWFGDSQESVEEKPEQVEKYCDHQISAVPGWCSRCGRYIGEEKPTKPEVPPELLGGEYSGYPQNVIVSKLNDVIKYLAAREKE